MLRLDAALQAGSLTETVEVESATTLLQTDVSSRGSVIDERKILNLPLNGRDYNQLALLSPGVLPGTPRLASVNFNGVLNVNGNRTFNNVFLLDGVDNMSYSNSFRGENVQLVQPSIEALQEFKIQTNAYSAEYGRSAGALVNAVIRSGRTASTAASTNFSATTALDAKNFFSKKPGARSRIASATVRRRGGRANPPQPNLLVRRLRRVTRRRGHPARPAGADRRGEGRPVPHRRVRPFAPGRPKFSRNAARLLGVPLPAATGRILIEALQ